MQPLAKFKAGVFVDGRATLIGFCDVLHTTDKESCFILEKKRN